MGQSPIQQGDRQPAPAVIRQWRMQRIGSAIMAALVVAGLLGLFSEGPVSTATARPSDGSFEVSYERFERRGGAGSLGLDVDSRHVRGGSLEVFLGDDLLGAFTIDAVTPTPTSVTVVQGGQSYAFDVQPGEPTIAIEFQVTPDTVGWRTSTVGVTGAGTVSIGQFFYP